jgi:hypothetical protein
MNAQAGERYKCSDANCGCEIEVKSPGRMQQGSLSDSTMNAGSFNERSRSNQPLGASGTGETGVGSLRNAESAGISTPGDFGSQGATGEGVFGTSGGNQRSTVSGRLGSTTAKSSRAGTQSVSTSNMETGSAGQSNFYCACGQLMQKTQSSSAARV